MRKTIGLTALMLLAACGDDPQYPSGGASSPYCLFENYTCSQLIGAFAPADLTTIQGMCTGSGGTYGVGTCSTAATVAGYCYYADVSPWLGVPGSMNDYYYTASWSSSAALADCGGVWVGGTGGGGTGTPVNESEANGTVATADGPYTSDVLISGAVSPLGDQDIFAIQNASGSPVTVHFETYEGTFGSCASADSVIVIENASGVLLASNDDGGINFCSMLDYTIPASTVVYLRVRAFADSETFSYVAQVDFQ